MLILFFVAVLKTGEPTKPKHGSPLPALSIMTPKAPGIPLVGDLNMIAPSWMGDGSVSLQLLLWP